MDQTTKTHMKFYTEAIKHYHRDVKARGHADAAVIFGDKLDVLAEKWGAGEFRRIVRLYEEVGQRCWEQLTGQLAGQ